MLNDLLRYREMDQTKTDEPVTDGEWVEDDKYVEKMLRVLAYWEGNKVLNWDILNRLCSIDSMDVISDIVYFKR